MTAIAAWIFFGTLALMIIGFIVTCFVGAILFFMDGEPFGFVPLALGLFLTSGAFWVIGSILDSVAS